jgi:hypothetical protein
VEENFYLCLFPVEMIEATSEGKEQRFFQFQKKRGSESVGYRLILATLLAHCQLPAERQTTAKVGDSKQHFTTKKSSIKRSE